MDEKCDDYDDSFVFKVKTLMFNSNYLVRLFFLAVIFGCCMLLCIVIV